MHKPDSLLTAAKRLADIAGMPWSDVQPYYRALQEDGGEDNTCWLPKSAGRNIWAAHPHFIARLMFALAGARTTAEAHEAVELARAVTPGGRQKYLTERDAAGVLAPLETEFFRLLADPQLAADVDNVEFRPDLGEVVVTTKSQGATIYARPLVVGEGAGKPAKPFRGFHTRGIIDGLVFRYVAETTKWRLGGDPPFNKAKADEELED